MEEFLIDLLVPLKDAPILSVDQNNLRRISLDLLKDWFDLLVSNLVFLTQVLNRQSEQLRIDLYGSLQVTQILLTKSLLVPQ